MKKLMVKGIEKFYGSGDNRAWALRGIDLEIEPGKFTAIVGQSGSGKSTLLHCMAGLDKPSSGSVFVDDLDIYTLNDDRLSKMRREVFGFVFQSFNLIPVINVYDNITLPILLNKGSIDKSYLDELIFKLGIEAQMNKFPNELSGGEQQRVAIARALGSKPSIIFADEPTGNLDSNTTNEVMNLLKFCVDKYNQTLIMITHNNEIVNSADTIININDGRIT